MKVLQLLALLVAGVAAAQPGPQNCRTSANGCSVASIITNSAVTVQTATANIVARDPSSATAYGLWIDRQASVNRGICLAGNTSTGVCLNSLLVDGTTQATFSSSIVVSGSIIATSTISSSIASGSVAFAASTGAWWDLGGGANDRLKSDGTNVLSDTHFGPVSDATSTLGLSAAAWLRGYFTAGVVLNQGTVVKWTAAPISDNTTATSQLVFNGDINEPVYASSSRKYNPLGQSKEWAVEKRALNVDVGMENANCPIGAPSIKGTGAAAVTFTCTDAAAAGSNTLSGESYRVLNTAASASSVSILDVSGNVTKRELGPKMIQRISIPAGSTSSVRIWVALVPTGTSLTSVDTGAISVIGFRFSTAVPDTNWQACSGDAASVVCTDTGTAPATASNLTLEIDCRETTACRFLINGSLVATRSSTLPATTTQLAPRVLVQTTNGTAKALWHGRSSLQTN